MNMTEVSGPNRACYYLNPTTKKLELGTYDESAVMEKLQKRAEELKKNPVGQNTLTNEEIQELIKLMSGEGCGCGCDSCGGGCGDNECDDCGCEGGHCHK